MDDNSLQRVLRDQLPDVAAPTTPPAGAAQRVRRAVASRRRRQRSVFGAGVAGAAFAVLAPLALIGTSGSDDTNDPVASDVGQWQQIAESPLSPRDGTASVWTGEEMIVAGGNVGAPCPPNADCIGPTQAELRADGAAYDPDTDSWRSIAAAPVKFVAATTSWTGREMVVLGTGRTLAYNPETDTWRQLDAPPGGYLIGGEWDGEELVFWQSEERANTSDWSLDPTTGTWTRIPDDPFGPTYDRDYVWTGERFVVFGLTMRGMLGGAYNVAEYDPATRTWTRLPEAPVEGGDPMWFFHQGKVVNPFEDPRLEFKGPTNGVYDPETKTWSEAPHAGRYTYAGCMLGPLGSAGDWLAPGGGVFYSLDPADTVVAPGCPQLPEPAAAVWTGEQVIIWGGPDGTFEANTSLGLTWTPPPAG